MFRKKANGASTASPSKVKGLHSSETLGTAQPATQSHIPEDLKCFSTLNLLYTFFSDQVGFVTQFVASFITESSICKVPRFA